VLKINYPDVRHVGTVTEVFTKKSMMPQKI
jgi:hypothetical protein